jgi:hypothetical protein
MSAYGSIAAPASGKQLSSRTYALPSGKAVTVFHVRRDSDSLSPALFAHLHGLFNSVLAEGRTYPQQGPLDAQAFRDYYLAADLFLGLLDDDADAAGVNQGGVDAKDKTIEGVIGSREIANVVLGMYCKRFCCRQSQADPQADCSACSDVKPNYPGRSSHVNPTSLGFSGPRGHHAQPHSIDLQRRFRRLSSFSRVQDRHASRPILSSFCTATG